MSQTGQRPPPSGGAIFFGCLLMAVGGLMALLCGSCTALFVGASLNDLFGPQGDASYTWTLDFILPVLLGGLPTLLGLALVWIGWRLIRPRRPRT